MSNQAGLTTSFKLEMLQGFHCFGSGVRATDTLKCALYLAGGSIGPATTAYSATGEVSGSGYTAGGVTVTNATAPSSSGTSAIWTPSANVSFPSVTLGSSFDCALFYNSTQSNRSIGAVTFPATTVSAGTYVINMPANGLGTSLVEID